MNRKRMQKADGARNGRRYLRLVAVRGAPTVLDDDRQATSPRYGGITAALDRLLSRDLRPIHTPIGAATGSDTDEARRLLRIGGRLRELAEQCLDPAAPALERLGRTVELSGRRRLLTVIGDAPSVTPWEPRS